MKSLTEITQNVTTAMQPRPAGQSLVLAARSAPMVSEDIVKMMESIEKYFVVKKEETYGYVPIMEGDIAVRQEFDVTGEITVYTPRIPAPHNLWEALLRPARNNHIVYHLGRLAAHRRDTRGAAAVQVVMEDISSDLRDVSEWSVIMACAEMRRKNATWYPNTGEIIDIIKKYDAMISGLYLKRLAPVEAKPAPKKYDKSQFYNDLRENPERRKLCDFLISKGKDDFFEMPVMYSNYHLEMMAGCLGYGKSAPAEKAKSPLSDFIKEMEARPSDKIDGRPVNPAVGAVKTETQATPAPEPDIAF